MALYVNRVGIHIPYDIFTDSIRRIFTVKHVDFNKRIHSWYAYHKGKDVAIAHSKGINLAKKAGFEIDCKISEGHSIKIGKSELKPLEHQSTLYKWLTENVYTGSYPQTCTLSLDPGRGKTYLALMFFRIWSIKTLVLVPNITLLKQWSSVVKSLFPDVQVGLVYGREKSDGDIVIACASSVVGTTIADIPSTEWFSVFGFTIFDEIHTFCTQQRSTLFRRATSRRVLAMSGTCNHRLDKLDQLYHLYYGEPIEASEIIGSQREMPDLQVTRVRYYGPDEFTEDIRVNDTLSFPLMINQIVSDPYRTELIITQTKRLYDDGHSVFVFVDRLSVVDAIKQKLEECTGETVNIINGSVKDEVVSRICIASYQCAGTGLSIKSYTAIVYATPRRNFFEQFNARIFREGGPKRAREIVYIQDMCTGLRSQYYSFKKITSDGFNATYHTIDHRYNVAAS